MKSPKIKGIGEVATEYGAKVMKVIKKGLLGRSLFDFYGDVKANALRVKESSSVPLTPNDKDGGVVYVKNSDGKLYYKSNEVSEVELSSHTGLSTEEVQDIAGALVATGGTKTGIAVTYQDGTGDVDFVVDHDAATNFTADEHFTQASITTVGTIGTGVWEGTTIKTAFIGDDQVTEDKLADTLLAEIDANTLKNTNVVGDLTVTAAGHKLQLNTLNGASVSLPLATTDAWGVMSDEMFDEHTANNAKVSNIVQTTITGNAGTATALVDGNQTITGTLTVNSSSSTGNPLLTFTQNGTRRAFIQLADNSGGYTNNLRINSEYGAITLGAASTNGVDSDTAYLTVEPTGIFKFGAVDSDAVLTTDGNMTFRIDADNNEASQKFAFQNNISTEIASLNDGGDLMITGDIELGNASDTTIARSGAGTVTIEGNEIQFQGVNAGQYMEYPIRDLGTYLFYIYNDDYWYSAGSSTLSILGNGSAPADVSSSNSEYQSRIGVYTAMEACTLKKLTFTFYWSSSVVSAADIDFGFSKFDPITDGTAAIIAMEPITATDHNGTYTESKPYQVTFTFSGGNATFAAGDAFAFHMRTTGGSNGQRVLVYGGAVLSIELN